MKVIKEIATGAFGIVEKVEHKSLGMVAKKTFQPRQEVARTEAQRQKLRKRFIREVGIQAQLEHPHIMPVLASKLDVDPPYFLMPLAEEDYMEQVNRDRAAGALDLDAALQYLEGVEELHRLDFVHRDLKPQNILKVEGKWVVSDLGLILPPDSAVTTKLSGTESAFGTKGYSAPELYTDFHAAPLQADIYSIGCMLHDVYGAGQVRVPFHKCSAAGAIGVIVEKCTERDPEDRFPSVAALRNALVMALSTKGSSVAERPLVKEWLVELEAPTSIASDTWLAIATFLEKNGNTDDAELVLRAIDLDQLDALNSSSPRAFKRIAGAMSSWVEDSTFDFNYCDVLGTRLLRIHELGGVKERSDAALAALEMGCRHNRWYVMRLFVRMASLQIEDDLAARLAVELAARDSTVLRRVEQIEQIIHVSRDSLHPKVAATINAIERHQSEVRARRRDSNPAV